jgi:hypothetical protein
MEASIKLNLKLNTIPKPFALYDSLMAPGFRFVWHNMRTFVIKSAIISAPLNSKSISNANNPSSSTNKQPNFATCRPNLRVWNNEAMVGIMLGLAMALVMASVLVARLPLERNVAFTVATMGYILVEKTNVLGRIFLKLKLALKLLRYCRTGEMVGVALSVKPSFALRIISSYTLGSSRSSFVCPLL